MSCFLVKFRGRRSTDISNILLRKRYVTGKGPKPELQLISSDNKTVKINKFVACLFSEYLEDYIRQFKPKVGSCSKYFCHYFFFFSFFVLFIQRNLHEAIRLSF